MDQVSVLIDPDDGLDHHPNSVQVSSDRSLQLSWSTMNATGVRIDPLGELAASGTIPIPTVDATYSVVALGDGGAESTPYPMEVHTHEPGSVVSPHVTVDPPTTTTSAAPETTTSAPPTTTTSAAPTTTTSAPPATTTSAAPATTTSAAPATTTSAPPETTTSAPPETTTSAAPATTTSAPPTTTTTTTPGTRLRLSLWSFNASFINGQKSTPTTIVLNDTQLKQLQDSRIDDFSLVRTITFKPGKPGEVAWGNFAPLGNVNLREPYLRALVSRLHAIKVQVMAGYEIVESGTQSSALGMAFNAWLNKPGAGEIDAHAQAIADFCAKFELDGINFDFEINSLGGAQFPNHKANLAQLYVKTAQKLAGRNGMVSYDAAPDTADGGNSNSFMKIQPLSLAGQAANLVARPMCFDAVNATSEATVRASIACALRATSTNKGSGLTPSQIQYGIWTSHIEAGAEKDVARWCRDVFRPNQVGVVLYNMDDQPNMLVKAKAWEAALNPGAPAPGTAGSPLQVPE